MAELLRARLIQGNGGGGGGGSVLPLTVRDLNVVDTYGKIQKLRSITAFTIWQDFINGEIGKLEDFVGYSGGLGITDYIGFGCWGNTNFNPTLIPNAYDKLAELDTWLNNKGGRLFLVLFTDQLLGSPVLMNSATQTFHITQCLFALKKNRTSRVEFANEYRKNWPGPYPIPYDRSIFDGLVADWSTWYDGIDPQESGQYLSFANKHTGGFDDEWSRKSKVCVEGQRGQGGGLGPYPPIMKPVVVRERCRIAEGSYPDEHAASTALEEGMGGGGNIHGGFVYGQHDSFLQRCEVPINQVALECIHAATKCYNIVPDYLAAIGNYANSGGDVILHDDNLMLRTYVMFENSNKAWVFRVRGRKPGMGITPINDWKVIDKRGYNDEVILLER